MIVLLPCIVQRGTVRERPTVSCCPVLRFVWALLDLVILIMRQGFAYLEFLEADAINSALLLDGSELHGRQIKVCHMHLNPWL